MITFDRSAESFVLSALGYAIDKDGYIIQEKSWQRVLATDKVEIRMNEVAAFTKEGIIRSPVGFLPSSTFLFES